MERQIHGMFEGQMMSSKRRRTYSKVVSIILANVGEPKVGCEVGVWR